jgi:hypothetical protein
VELPDFKIPHAGDRVDDRDQRWLSSPPPDTGHLRRSARSAEQFNGGVRAHAVGRGRLFELIAELRGTEIPLATELGLDGDLLRGLRSLPVQCPLCWRRVVWRKLRATPSALARSQRFLPTSPASAAVVAPPVVGALS